MSLTDDIKRPENSHIWQREEHEHYVEPEWCSRRLFEVEHFNRGIWDPCCGFGRIPQAAVAHGMYGIGNDIDDEGLCMCHRCTDRLLAANARYFRQWLAEQAHGERPEEPKR